MKIDRNKPVSYGVNESPKNLGFHYVYMEEDLERTQISMDLEYSMAKSICDALNESVKFEHVVITLETEFDTRELLNDLNTIRSATGTTNRLIDILETFLQK
jgi:hypothetical protein